MISKYGTIGILGGMGPEATANAYHEIIDSTPVTKDQEHIPVIIYSNPQIPDRTHGLLYDGESPLPELLVTTKKLEYSGADFVIIPCNTSHFFIKEMRASVNIPVISMIEETLAFVKNKYPHITKVGLLATTGTIKTGIYKNIFSSANIDIISPEGKEQETLVMESIYGDNGIKSGKKEHPNKLLKKAVLNLQNKGAELIIMGCTEIPLALNQKEVDCILINPTRILCEKAVLLAKEHYKHESELIIEEEEE
jgi:aspartate racemase